VTDRVALAAQVPAVRARLLLLQRSAPGFGGIVADGRDMGTVVFPDAAVKVFLTASLEERAARRLLQEGREAGGAAVLRERERLDLRDRRDIEREVAPLRAAEGAILIDTSDLSFEEQVTRVVEAARGLTEESRAE
jgi:cytidylate kinase